MKKIALIFISSVSVLVPGLSVAESMVPPSGPYRSIETDISSSSYAYERENTNGAMDMQQERIQQDRSSAVPEWVKKRREDMVNWLKQQNNQASMQNANQYNHQPKPMQNNNPQAMQWNQAQPPMNMPRQQMNPQAMNPQLSQPQMNRMKQYFPTSRGPVYGPNVPPPAIYNNPNYQNKPPVNQYPPMWR